MSLPISVSTAVPDSIGAKHSSFSLQLLCCSTKIWCKILFFLFQPLLMTMVGDMYSMQCIYLHFVSTSWCRMYWVKYLNGGQIKFFFLSVWFVLVPVRQPQPLFLTIWLGLVFKGPSKSLGHFSLLQSNLKFFGCQVGICDHGE